VVSVEIGALGGREGEERKVRRIIYIYIYIYIYIISLMSVECSDSFL
jgi:hypothetical protein